MSNQPGYPQQQWFEALQEAAEDRWNRKGLRLGLEPNAVPWKIGQGRLMSIK